MGQTLTMLKWILVTLCGIEMMFFSGMMFGINSIFPMLTDLKYFCFSKNSSNPCQGQKKNFGYLFVTFVVSITIFSIPVGSFLDHFGVTKAKVFCIFTSFFGFLCFVLSYYFDNRIAFLAVILLGFFSQALMICNYSVSTIFPAYESKIVAVFSGSFDFSSITMTFIVLAYKGGVSMVSSFSFLGLTGATLTTATSLLSYIISHRTQTEHTAIPTTEEADPVSTTDGDESIDDCLEEKVAELYPVIRSVLFSHYYLVHLVNLALHSLAMNFFLAQLYVKLHHLFPLKKDIVDTLLINSNYVFGFGLLVSPLVGLLIDFHKRKNVQRLRNCHQDAFYQISLSCFVSSLLFCAVCSQTMLALVIIPHQVAVYSAYVMWMLLRVTIFTVNSLYLLNAFPKMFFGQLIGITFSMSGLLSFVQYGMIFDDVQRLNTVNYVMIGVLLLTYIHPVVLAFKLRKQYFPSD